MVQLGEYIGLALDRLDIGAGDLYIVDIKPRQTHVERGCTEGCDVVLKGYEFCCDILRLSAEALKLLRHRLCRCDIVGFLSAEDCHVIDYLIEALGFESHGLHDLGISCVDVIIAVRIR